MGPHLLHVIENGSGVGTIHTLKFETAQDRPVWMKQERAFLKISPSVAKFEWGVNEIFFIT